jgi:hypothetical protein
MVIYQEIKATALPASPIANAVYFIKALAESNVSIYVTDQLGVAFPASGAAFAVNVDGGSATSVYGGTVGVDGGHA